MNAENHFRIDIVSLASDFFYLLILPSRSSSFVMIPASESLDEILELDTREQSMASSD